MKAKITDRRRGVHHCGWCGDELDGSALSDVYCSKVCRYIHFSETKLQSLLTAERLEELRKRTL